MMHLVNVGQFLFSSKHHVIHLDFHALNHGQFGMGDLCYMLYTWSQPVITTSEELSILPSKLEEEVGCFRQLFGIGIITGRDRV